MGCKSAWTLSCKIYLYYTGQLTNLPFAPEGDVISIFPACLLYKHSWIDSLEKTHQCLYSQDVQKHERLVEDCLPTFVGAQFIHLRKRLNYTSSQSCCDAIFEKNLEYYTHILNIKCFLLLLLLIIIIPYILPKRKKKNLCTISINIKKSCKYYY